MNTTQVTPPICKIEPHEMSIHGDTRIDNYFWLNQRENPEVIDYLNKENDYTSSVLKPTEKLQKDLFAEMKGRIKEEDQSVPVFTNGFYYKTRYEEGGEYPIYARSTDSSFDNEIILLNGNEMAKGFDYFDIGGFSISEDNAIIAYSTDTLSRRLYNLQFKNSNTGELYPEVIINTSGGSAWANDNKTIFYTKKDPETLRSHQVYRHVLGTSQEEDILVYEEEDETFNCYVFKSKSKKYLIIGSSSTLTDEYRLLNADAPTSSYKVFQPRERGLEYAIYHHKDRFIILTNADGATNFKLMQCDENTTEKSHWKTFIEHQSNTLIEDVLLFDNHLIISERKNGLVALKVINSTTNASYYIPFNDETYVAYLASNPEFNTDKLRFWYTSLTTPGTTFEMNMNSQVQVILKQEEVVGGYDADQYESKRLFATARDGVKVPISLVYKKSAYTDGTTPLPLLQYAYGSYGSSMDPYFSTSRLSLLDRGFIFAIAHIRGGEEMGREWYENGKLLKKKNTFNDFIDCSVFLIEEGLTSNDQLFAMGGSAGGLLMGAIINDRPDLYQGVIASVPFVDVITTMLDESIPLTTGEYDEWGNPNEKESYEYMLSYSPYDQVKVQDYPNLLVTTGLHDSQVQYWEPAKWVAKLRATKTDDNLLLLHTNMEAGHGGASGRFEYLKEVAREYAFLLYLSEDKF